MSSMLEQAIVDAAALREAALKNAEQAIIEKYAPQIKSAVDEMLEQNVSERALSRNQLVRHEGRYARITTESDDGKVGIKYLDEDKTSLVMESELEQADEALLAEELGAEAPAMGAAPAADSVINNIPLGSGITPGGELNLSMNVYEFNPEDFNVDLKSLHLSDEEKQALETEAAPEAAPEEDAEIDLGGLEDLAGGEEAPADSPPPPDAELPDSVLEEHNDVIDSLLSLIEEELTVDMGEDKAGWTTTDEGTLKYEQEKELASMEDSEEKEEDEEYKKKIEELDETIKRQETQKQDLLKIIDELSNTLNETLLSNAKLLYCNKTLSDASLNERQKSKIVETIAQARTPEEARSLCETLNATVGSTKPKSPRTLSESVQRKSNLSSVLPRRKQPSQDYSFAEHMKKLAGITK